MKTEKILEMLNNFIESDNVAVLLDLKSKLEDEVRKSGALKTNSKSRVSAITRIQKYNEKVGRTNLVGCGVKDNEYYFTDSYMYAILKDSCNLEIKENYPTDSLYNIDSKQELERIYLGIEDISYYVKTKQDFKDEYFGKDKCFDYKFLKNAIDILGNKDIELYASKSKEMLVFKNKENERVGVLCKRVY